MQKITYRKIKDQNTYKILLDGKEIGIVYKEIKKWIAKAYNSDILHSKDTRRLAAFWAIGDSR